MLIASGLGLRDRKHGWIFRDLDLTLEPGQIHALTGVPGSGRTTALLSLLGFFKHTHGTVTRPRSALGYVRNVHEPEPMLTAHEHLTERARLLRAKRPAGAKTLARDLSPLGKHLLMLDVALIGEPELIGIDDLDVHLTVDEQLTVLEAIEQSGRSAIFTTRHDPRRL